jgi:carbon starvation protein
VTIACGACSGFHGLVCSGTTSKQIDREAHCHPIGYGAMLLEAFVAILALSTVIIVVKGDAMPGPGKIYGDGLGRFMTVIIGKENFIFAATFGAMAFSTFIFDTLDVSTRLGRYVLEEVVGLRGKLASAAATLATLVIPAAFVATARPPAASARPAYMDFWLLFGTSNQLLAALTLLAVTVWLYKERRRVWYTAVPMVFVMAITVWALVRQVLFALSSVGEAGFRFDAATMNGFVGLALVGLALALLFEAAKALLATRSTLQAS